MTDTERAKQVRDALVKIAIEEGSTTNDERTSLFRVAVIASDETLAKLGRMIR